MRDAIVTAGLLVAVFSGFIIDRFVPPLEFAAGARVFLMPVFFCAGACTVGYPFMLALAVGAGLMTDLISLQPIGDSVEISPGWTILLLVAVGSICQGVRPLVLRGQWWIPSLMSALTAILILGSQFLAITMRRFDTGGLVWNDAVTARILVPGLVALVLSLIGHGALEAFNLFTPRRRSLRDF